MAYDQQFSAHGVSEVGSFTGTKGGTYTEVPWGLTSEEGASLTANVNTVEQRSGQSASVIDSFITDASAQLRLSLLSLTADNLRKLMGLPASALVGDLADPTTPTMETLTVLGSQLGSEEVGLYVRTPGPLGPITFYFPRAKVSSFPELNFSRTAYVEPSATFDIYEDADGALYWVEFAEA